MMMKTIKITDLTYVELLRLKADLTAQDGEIRTFGDAIQQLLGSFAEMRKILGACPTVEKIQELAKKLAED